jgi:flagellar hook assembly protein FlgD
LVFSFQNAVDAPETASLPTKLALAAPRPNPFQGRSQIAYDLPQDAPVRIAVFDLAGRNVVSLVDEVRPAGRHAVTWDGRDRAGDRVAAGIYFVRLESRDFRQVRKVTVIR